MAGGLALAGALHAGAASAASFPARALTLVAPTNPGGGWDIFARAMQFATREDRLAPVPMEVMNRGGAGGTISLAELVSRHRGNPHIAMITGSVMVSSAIAHNSPLKVRDATPVAKIASDYLVVAVPASSPYRTMDELLEAFRKAPDDVAWCGGSAGSVDHMLFGMIAEAAGVSPQRIRYVAYAGAGEATAAFLGGQVQAGITGYSEWRNLRDDGRARFLGVSSQQRIDTATPTLIEAGVPISLENWRGLLTAPDLSPEERDWWVAFARRVHASPHWQELAKRYGWHDTYLDGPELLTFIAEEEAQAAVVLARLGISAGGSGYAAMGPWAFPKAIGAAAAVAAVGLALEHRGTGGSLLPLGKDGTQAADEASAGEAEVPEAPPGWKRFAVGFGLTVAYVVAMQLAGFLLATPVFVVAACRLLGSRSHVRDALAAVVLTIGVWLLFSRVLHLVFP